MKKSFITTLIIMLVLTLTLGVFLGAMGGAGGMAAGLVCPDAGWNSRTVSCTFGALDTLQELAYEWVPVLITPCAGWNS